MVKTRMVKVRMILDTKDKNGNWLFSGTIHKVDNKLAKELLKTKRAFIHIPKKRIVSTEKKYVVDGKFLTRSEMLKLGGKKGY